MPMCTLLSSCPWERFINYGQESWAPAMGHMSPLISLLITNSSKCCLSLSSAVGSFALERRQVRDWREWNSEERGRRCEGREEKGGRRPFSRSFRRPLGSLFHNFRFSSYLRLFTAFFMKEPLRRREVLFKTCINSDSKTWCTEGGDERNYVRSVGYWDHKWRHTKVVFVSFQSNL